MESMNITSAQYFKNAKDDADVVTGVRATIDGRTLNIPLDPANRHYAEILKQVEAGTLVIQEADGGSE